MKTILAVLLCLVAVSAFGAMTPIPPYQPNAWTTNVAGNPVTGQNNLSVTNLGSTTNWTFFNVNSKTVARLGDVSNTVNSVTGNFVRITGDTMTGQLNAPSIIISNSLTGLTPALSVHPFIGSATNRFQVLNTNRQPVVFVNSNAVLSASNALILGTQTNSSYLAVLGVGGTNNLIVLADYPIVRELNTNTTITASKTIGTYDFYTVDASTGGTGIAGELRSVATGSHTANACNTKLILATRIPTGEMSNSMTIDYDQATLPTKLTIAPAVDTAILSLDVLAPNGRELMTRFGMTNRTRLLGITTNGTLFQWLTYQDSANYDRAYLSNTTAAQVIGNECTGVGTNKPINFRIGGLTAMRLYTNGDMDLPSGNLSIGIAQPQNQRLYVNATNLSTSMVVFVGASNSTAGDDVSIYGNQSTTDGALGANGGPALLIINTFPGSTNVYGIVGFNDAGGNAVAYMLGRFLSDPGNAGQLEFWTRDYGGNALQRMILNQMGMLCIGTNFAAARVHIVGTGETNDLLRLGTTRLDPSASINTNGVIFTLVRTNFNSTNWAPLTTNIAQQIVPLGQFAYMASAASNYLVLSGAITDYTNFCSTLGMERITTNGFTGSLTLGTLTNVHAGYYRITASMTVWPEVDNNGDEIEGEIFLNESPQEFLSDVHTLATDNASDISVTGIIYMPAGTGVSFRIRNRSDATSSLPVIRRMISIGTP